MLRWGLYIGALLFVTGVTLSFIVVFTHLPGIPSLSVIWFAIGLVMAVIGYLTVVIENYLRYRTIWRRPFR